jgi:hypothetical protein
MATSKSRSEAPQEVWERFEEAVYEYAQECALIELEREGDVRAPGGVSWAYEHMEKFFENFYGEVFADLMGLDGDYVQEEAQYRFLVRFRDGWRVAISGLSSEEVG